MSEDAADGAAPAVAGTVVMGAAIGQQVDHVLPFLTSLRKCGYTGAIVLFVDRRLAAELRALPIARDVELVPVGQSPPFRYGLLSRRRIMRLGWSPLAWAGWLVLRALGALPDGRLRRTALASVAQFACTPMEARFFHFLRYLARSEHRVALICDVRDVLFQRDPFLTLPAAGLAVSLEARSYTVGTERHNARWLRRVYGSEVLGALADRPVSCVGVSYGARPAMLAYLTAMTAEFVAMSPRRADVGGADTAAHNYLLWSGRLADVHPQETLASPIATLNGIDEATVRLTADGRLLNADGSTPSIVHQYDRLPTLGERLRRAVA